ncbi:Breast cancer 2, early onset [Chamberlinius hualienensis]
MKVKKFALQKRNESKKESNSALSTFVYSQRECKQDELSSLTFSSLLTPDVVKELGVEDPYWFGDLSVSPENEHNSVSTVLNGTKENSLNVHKSHEQRSDTFVNKNACHSVKEQQITSESCDFLYTQHSGQPFQAFGFSPPTPVYSRDKRPEPNPVRVALSLGATFGDHELSWTTSMETPLSRKVESKKDWSILRSRLEKREAQPKALFNTSGSKNEDIDAVTVKEVNESAIESDFFGNVSVEESVFLVESDFKNAVANTNESVKDLTDLNAETTIIVQRHKIELDCANAKTQETNETFTNVNNTDQEVKAGLSEIVITSEPGEQNTSENEFINSVCDKSEVDLQTLLLSDTQTDWITLEDAKTSKDSLDNQLKLPHCYEEIVSKTVVDDEDMTLNDWMTLDDYKDSKNIVQSKLSNSCEEAAVIKTVVADDQDILATSSDCITVDDSNNLNGINRNNTNKEHLKLTISSNEIVVGETAVQDVTRDIVSTVQNITPISSTDVHCAICCSQGQPKELQYDTCYVILNGIPPGMYQLTYSEDFNLQTAGQVQLEKSMSETISLDQNVEVRNAAEYGAVTSVEENGRFSEMINESHFKGFTTAGGRSVKISDDAMKRARTLFEDVLPDDISINNDYNHYIFRPESLNEPSYAGSNNSFNNVVHANNAGDSKLTGFRSNCRDDIPGMSGFSTANGKPINVSAGAIRKAKELWDIVDSEHSVTTEVKTLNNSTKNIETTVDIESNNVEKKETKVIPLPISKHVGFCTGSGKVINVCDESLTKAKKLFDSIETDLNLSKDEFMSCGSSFVGFKTATGKNISVSEESILKAKRTLLVDEDQEDFSKFNTSTPVVYSSEACAGAPNETLKTRDVNSCNLRTPELRVPISRKRLPTGEENVERRSSHNSTKAEISVEDWEEMVADFLEDEAIGSVAGKTGNIEKENLSNEIDLSTAALLADETEAGEFEVDCLMSSQTCSAAKSKRKGTDLATTPRRSKRLRVKGSHINSQVRNDVLKSRADRLMDKLHGKVKPVMGRLWKLKHSNKKISIKDFVGSSHPLRLTFNQLLERGLKKSTLNVNVSNAEEYCFALNELTDSDDVKDGTLNMACGAVLIYNEDNRAGKSEFHRALLDTPGVDPNLIAERWVFNHYRWIIWKLASLEIKFPDEFGGKLLTPNTVLDQLHYRYNCEIDHSQRSAIKKLVEQDDTPFKTIILCVVSIYKNNTSEKGSHLLDVTDGWYVIKAITDEKLSSLIQANKIFVGTKLIIFGCEFSSSFNACDPLEIDSNVTLKLNANSCRRARWHSKLGFQYAPLPSLSIKSLYPDGGRLPAVDILVARVFPMQYLERKGDGSYCVYNDRTNDRAARLFEADRNAYLEELSRKFAHEFDEQDSRRLRTPRSSMSRCNLSREKIETLNSGEEICDLLETSNDPSAIESYLTENQKTQLIIYKQSVNDKRRQLIEKEILSKGKSDKERNIVPFVKFVAVGLSQADKKSSSYCTVTVWKPSSDLDALLQEGRKLKVFNLCADNRRSESELNLKSTKQTRFTEFKDISKTTEKDFVTRKLTSFKCLCGDFLPVYGVVDIVGVVIKSRLKEQGRFDCVYVADANMDIISLKFWDGLKAFSLEDVLISETFILATNLQWRGKILSPIQCLYATEISCFTQRPRDPIMRAALDDLERSITDRKFYAKAAEKIAEMLKESAFGRLPINVGTPSIGKPVSSSTPVQRYRTLQCHDTSKLHTPCSLGSFVESPVMNETPTSKKIDQKYRTLQRYGDPSPNLSISLPNSSHCKKPFKPPLKR